MLKKIKYSILNNRRIYEAALIIISSLLGVITFLVSYNNTLSGFLFVGLTVLYVFLATFNIFACHKAIIYRQELGNYYIGNIPIPKISLLPSYIGSVDYIRNKLHIQNVSIDWEVINDDIAYNTKFSLTKNSKTTTFNYTLLEKASRVKKSQPPILKCSSSSDECPCQGPPKIHYERIHTYSYKLPEPPKKFDELNISYRIANAFYWGRTSCFVIDPKNITGQTFKKIDFKFRSTNPEFKNYYVEISQHFRKTLACCTNGCSSPCDANNRTLHFEWHGDEIWYSTELNLCTKHDTIFVIMLIPLHVSDDAQDEHGEDRDSNDCIVSQTGIC